MSWKSGRFGASVGLVVWSWLAGPAGPALADEPLLPSGRWAVESTGLGLPTRLDALEIRPSSRSGEADLVAFEHAEGGARPWGTARVDRKGTGPYSARWFAASWTSGSSTILIQLRPEGPGRLVALIRERPMHGRPGDRVRQATLARVPADERPVVDGPARPATIPPASFRLEPDGRDPSRARASGVFVAGVDGSEVRAISRADGFATAAHPAWSPDGRWMAFAGFDASGRDPIIRVIPASGGPGVAVASGSQPSWSSDGSRIAYVASGRADYATDWAAPGRNDERIEVVTVTGPGAGESEVIARGIGPRWSPVDGRLAFVARREANWDLYIRSADGLGLDRRTDDPAFDTQPTWAADGRSLVFLSDRGNRWDLYRVAAEGREPARRLTDHARREDSPSLAPDGRRVAFVDGRGPSDGSILILDLDRATVRAFPDRPDADRDPAWSPDGRSIAFVSRRPAPPGP